MTNKDDPDVRTESEPAVSALPPKLDRWTGISPIVIDTTSQSDSDVATIQIQETIKNNKDLIPPDPHPDDENYDSDSADTQPLSDPAENCNERLKEVEED